MLRYFKVWLVVGWLMVLAMCYLSLTSSPPDLNINVKYFDKIGHFAAYFILMFWFAQLYKKPKLRFFYVFFFISMGVVLEILQGLGGVRYFEYNDMLANSLGVAIAWRLTKGKLNCVLLYIEDNAF